MPILHITATAPANHPIALEQNLEKEPAGSERQRLEHEPAHASEQRLLTLALLEFQAFNHLVKPDAMVIPFTIFSARIPINSWKFDASLENLDIAAAVGIFFAMPPMNPRFFTLVLP